MATPQELWLEIKNDIKWTFEKSLEKKAFEALNKLKKEGKMSQEEITKLYNTNFKKFLQVDVKTDDILVQKILQIDNVTKKLLALQLSKPKESEWLTSKAKDLIYRTANIDKDIYKNSSWANIAKGVIDEILSIPEMLEQAIKHPIDFAKWLKSALIDNFSQTMKAMKEQFTDIASWLWNAESQYKTWRSAVLIIMTFFPWWLWKTLLNIGKSVPKLFSKAWRSSLKNWAELSIKTAKSSVKESIKKPINYIKESKLWIKYNNLTAKNTVKNTIKQIKNLWDDIISKQKELISTQKNLNIKWLKPDRIKELNDQIAKLQKEIPDLLKKEKDLNKNLKIAEKKVSQTNTKLWIDNRKLWTIKRYEGNIKKLWDDIALKQKELVAAQKNLNIKWLKPDRIKELNDQIAKLQKEIPDLWKKQKELINKAKNVDVRIPKPLRENIRKRIYEKISKSVNIENLNKLLKSPNRVSIAKDLFGLRKINNKIKKITQQDKSIMEKLNKINPKNWKTLLENAKINPNLKRAKNVFQQERLLQSSKNAIGKMQNMQKIIKERTYNQLTWLWIISLSNIKEFNDEKVYNLSEYLLEDNDQFIENNSESLGLESGKTEINSIDTSMLEWLSNIELSSTKLVITWLASKTWTNEINKNIANERANNAKKLLLEKYPWLNVDNITVNYMIQPENNNEDSSTRQWVKMNIQTENFAYIKGYKQSNNQTAIS